MGVGGERCGLDDRDTVEDGQRRGGGGEGGRRASSGNANVCVYVFQLEEEEKKVAAIGLRLDDSP